MQSSYRSNPSRPSGVLGVLEDSLTRISGCSGGSARTSSTMSTTRSARTGTFAIGSTVISRPRSRTGVTHPRTSRSFTRTPHVPHDAWRHECRIASDGRAGAGSIAAPRAPSCAPRPARRTFVMGTLVAALEPEHPEPAGLGAFGLGRRSVRPPRSRPHLGRVERFVGKQHGLAGAAPASTPSLRQITSAHSSAIPRSVVPLPPVIVTNPSTPSDSAWSYVLKVLESSRPLSAPVSPISGRAADQAARNRRRRDRGDQPRALLDHPANMVLGDLEVVGVLDRPRARADDRQRALRHDDVAVAGAVQAVHHHVHRRPRTATITPGEGRTGTLTPAIVATCSLHGPVAFTTTSARISPTVPLT